MDVNELLLGEALGNCSNLRRAYHYRPFAIARLRSTCLRLSNLAVPTTWITLYSAPDQLPKPQYQISKKKPTRYDSRDASRTDVVSGQSLSRHVNQGLPTTSKNVNNDATSFSFLQKITTGIAFAQNSLYTMWSIPKDLKIHIQEVHEVPWIWVDEVAKLLWIRMINPAIPDNEPPPV
ncbi:hypothetical protein BC830DRAFT_1132241, partial [Chytriomyces sp. MP71]